MTGESDPRFLEFRRTSAPKLRNELVEDNQRLADYLARRYTHRGVPDADLRQVAYIGLINAVDRFDPAMGVKFATFAGRTIEGELKRHFRDATWMVRVARGAKDRSLDVRNAIDRLTNELGRSPKPHEVALSLGISEDAVIEALDVSAARSVDSLDRPAGLGGVEVGGSVGGSDPGFDAVDGELTLEELLPLLGERERQIVELRVYRQLSQSEIAAQVGLSQMHVSRLLRRSLETLRQATET